jgi:hypothetical protein
MEAVGLSQRFLPNYFFHLSVRQYATGLNVSGRLPHLALETWLRLDLR